MIQALPFVALDVALLTLAIRRPWHALVALLGILPLNGLITQVAPVALGLDKPARLAVSGWHDALLIGIVLAAVWQLARMKDRRLTVVEWLVVAMLLLGAVYVAISPVVLTAAYAYRVLYEPPLLLAAITVLARRQPLPTWALGRAAMAFVAGTVAGALFTWPQVYVLRYSFLQRYFTEPGQQIHHSYLATGINQPRGIGLVTSPNEFGAVLAIAIVLLAVPGLVPIRHRWRFWLLGALSLALVLSFSRSGMLATGVGLIAVGLLTRDQWLRPRAIWDRIRSRVGVVWGAPAAVVWAALLVVILTTSGAPKLVKDTISGVEPSAGGRVDSVLVGLKVLKENPLGLGLGTAGPKAARFGETNGRPRILTETWYVLYAIQVGVFGLLLLALTALAILLRAWRSRASPVARFVIAAAVGLGAGALFIPIIEEPTIYTPLWAFAGLALALGAAASGTGGRTAAIADSASVTTSRLASEDRSSPSTFSRRALADRGSSSALLRIAKARYGRSESAASRATAAQSASAGAGPHSTTGRWRTLPG
ncbi:MAG: O-antigen ligase family protein [Chloroflexota bacterium]